MRIVFIGTGEIGVPTLRALQKSEHELVGVVTQPDKPVGRSQKITAPPIKAALAGSKMSILQPARIKNPEAIDQIRALVHGLWTDLATRGARHSEDRKFEFARIAFAALAWSRPDSGSHRGRRSRDGRYRDLHG